MIGESAQPVPIAAVPAPAAAPSRYLQFRRDIAAVSAAIILGLVVLWAFRLRGWYPHDEGTLGQSAERVLRGEIPHREFDDPYTGGLAYLHALVFRIGGISTTALRNQLALIATAWFAGVFWLLTRWLRPFGAALVAALIAVWSVPLYPAAMPSWYVLFLACAAGGVLVRWPRRAYAAAFVAGGLIGIAALAKITAAFALSGAAWALVAIRQDEETERHGAVEVVIAALVFGAMVLRLLSSSLDARVIAHLALPPLAIAAGIAWREIRHGQAHGFGVDTELWRRVGALCVGMAIPVVLFAAWLAAHGALALFLASAQGVVGGRATSASLPPPTVRSIGYALPLLAVLLGGASWMRVRPAVLVGAGIALGALAWFYPTVHGDIWKALRGLLPAGALLFCILWPRGIGPGNPVARRALIVFAPFAGIMALTQYPFAATIYFVYVIPLLVLALAGAIGLRSPISQRPAALVAALLTLFAVIEVIPGAGQNTGMTAQGEPHAWLDLPRSHLLVPTDEAERYRALIATLDSMPAGPIWAGPDAPEVAFLSARVDLNRSFFGFLNDVEQGRPDFASQLVARGARIVVIDTAPSFSRHVSQAALDSVTRYFPHTSSVDNFEVHWRGDGP